MRCSGTGQLSEALLPSLVSIVLKAIEKEIFTWCLNFCIIIFMIVLFLGRF
jgi:hypothetical protein